MQPKKTDKLVQALVSWEEGMARLGECIVQFQRIEDALSICVSAMIGRSRQVGEIVTSEMSYRARVSVYGALFLYSLKADTLPEDVVDLIKRLYCAEQERNTLVHSLWDASESQPDSIRREKKAIRKRAFGTAEEHFTPEDLDELNRIFEGIITDVFYLTSKHLPRIAGKLP